MPDDVVRQQPVAGPVTQVTDVVKQAPLDQTQPLIDTPAPTKQSVEPAKVKKPKSSKPFGVIVAAVLICALLIAGVIYLQIHKSQTPVTKQTINSVPAAAGTSANDLNAAVSDTESVANQPTEPSTDLSDQALGL